jgi:hypothetical protein
MSAKPNEICATGMILEKQTPADAALEMWHSWKQSPGHWAAASKPHTYFGAEMCQGKNGTWYGTVTMVDLPEVKK